MLFFTIAIVLAMLATYAGNDPWKWLNALVTLAVFYGFTWLYALYVHKINYPVNK